MENPMDQEHEDDDSGGGGGGFQMEHLQSYLSFAKFTLRKRWLTFAAVLIAGVCLSVLASIYWPRPPQSIFSLTRPVGRSGMAA